MNEPPDYFTYEARQKRERMKAIIESMVAPTVEDTADLIGDQ